MNPVELVDKCTTCSICVPHCPVMRVTRAFSGPKLSGPSAERFRLLDKDLDATREEMRSLTYCSNCKTCDIACPSGVRISILNMRARAEYCRQSSKPPLRDWIVSHGNFLSKIARLFPSSLIRYALEKPFPRKILDWFGIDRRAPVPFILPRSFLDRVAERSGKASMQNRKALFFSGCFVNDYDIRTGLDVLELMEMAGYEVIVPDFACCGLPLVSNGFMEEARQVAIKNYALLKTFIQNDPDIPILTVCPSCTLMLRQEYRDLFPELATEADIIAPHIEDACEFIFGLLEEGLLNPCFREKSSRLVYHTPCHLQALGAGKPGLRLLRQIPGVSVLDTQAGCCGLSGSYGFKKDKYDIAVAIGADAFRAVRDSRAERCATECGTCRLQISHHTRVPSVHPLSILREHIEE